MKGSRSSTTSSTPRLSSRRRQPKPAPSSKPPCDISAAARYLRMPENTVRTWAFGRGYRIGAGKPRRTPPLIDVAGGQFLSFVNLVELHALGALRREPHIDMRNIRRAIQYL